MLQWEVILRELAGGLDDTPRVVSRGQNPTQTEGLRDERQPAMKHCPERSLCDCA